MSAAKAAKTLAAKAGSNSECVRVVVRCRPLSTKEINEKRRKIVSMDLGSGCVHLENLKEGAKGDEGAARQFTFDMVFDQTTPQYGVYEAAAKPIVDCVLEGYNGTIFAYGQTGTGKTHTMEGKDEPAELQGIIPNAFRHVFDFIDRSTGAGDADGAAQQGQQFLVRASFLEIYNEEIRDLLSKNPNEKLDVKEHSETGVYVKDLTSFVVKGVDEIRQVLAVGKKNRTVGATLMNQDSSRSHSIFTITVESSCVGETADSTHIRVGKLNLVDLAGSERQSKTGATGDRLKEATKINLSLAALGNVISSLVEGGGRSRHIPYRDSKLTRLLQDSLGGNTKTVMIANIGPADYNFDETMSTLRYANRAKNIKNKPKINEDPKDAMLREYQDEIAKLKAMLQEQGGALDEDAGAGPMSPAPLSPGGTGEEEVMEEIRQKMREEIAASYRGSENGSISSEALDDIRREIVAAGQAKIDEMLGEKERTDEEKRQISAAFESQLEDMEAFSSRLEAEREQREEMEKKLRHMESRLLGSKGVDDLIAQKEEKEAVLEERHRELRHRRSSVVLTQEKIAELEEMQALKDQEEKSLADEAVAISKKLKRAVKQYQTIKADLQEINEELQHEREDLHDSIRQLSHQMKLKNTIIDAFIPSDDVQKIMRRANWDEETETWILEQLPASNAANRPNSGKRPVSAANSKRPTSGYAKMVTAMGDLNPRFKSENILQIELDLPERTTSDFSHFEWNDRVHSALEKACIDEHYLLSSGVEYMSKNAAVSSAASMIQDVGLKGLGAQKPGTRERARSSRRGSRSS